MRGLRLILSLLLVLCAGMVGAQEAQTYRTAELENTTDRVNAMAALHSQLSALEGAEAVSPYVVRIPAAKLAEINAPEKQAQGRMLVGTSAAVDFTYTERPSFGTTVLSGDTAVWSGAFQSEGAKGVRLLLTNVDLPKGAQLYVFGRYGHAYGPYSGAHKELWTNTIPGDELVLQLHVPGATGSFATNAASFQVASLTHLGDRFSLGISGDEAFCSWNDSCIQNAECSSIPSAVQDAQDAVAYLVYNVGSSAFICSGGLLNDTSSSGTPYLLTANHCFDTQSSASSLEAYFRWQVGCGASCGSQYNPPGSVPVVNGSSLLATSATTDFTLVQLSGSAPSGSVFLGWTTTAIANTAGVNLYRVSHPSGSPQAYSTHSVNSTSGTCGGLPRGNFIYSNDTFGGTEGGSSGSPVVNSSGQVVGQLFGACGASPATTCDNDDRTVDGAFAVTYNSISQYLTGSGGGPGGGGCPSGYTEYTGTASAGSGDLVSPTFSGIGYFNGILTCDNQSADLDLYLDQVRNNGTTRVRASSTSVNCNEEIQYTYNRRTRNYRWRVSPYSGSSSFTLCVNQP
ncbi:MAG: trypsin-like peptidase domain-containing protein [Acidobacteriota bacterium]